MTDQHGGSDKIDNPLGRDPPKQVKRSLPKIKLSGLPDKAKGKVAAMHQQIKFIEPTPILIARYSKMIQEALGKSTKQGFEEKATSDIEIFIKWIFDECEKVSSKLELIALILEAQKGPEAAQLLPEMGLADASISTYMADLAGKPLSVLKDQAGEAKVSDEKIKAFAKKAAPNLEFFTSEVRDNLSEQDSLDKLRADMEEGGTEFKWVKLFSFSSEPSDKHVRGKFVKAIESGNYNFEDLNKLSKSIFKLEIKDFIRIYWSTVLKGTSTHGGNMSERRRWTWGDAAKLAICICLALLLMFVVKELTASAAVSMISEVAGTATPGSTPFWMGVGSGLAAAIKLFRGFVLRLKEGWKTAGEMNFSKRGNTQTEGETLWGLVDEITIKQLRDAAEESRTIHQDEKGTMVRKIGEEKDYVKERLPPDFKNMNKWAETLPPRSVDARSGARIILPRTKFNISKLYKTMCEGEESKPPRIITEKAVDTAFKYLLDYLSQFTPITLATGTNISTGAPSTYDVEEVLGLEESIYNKFHSDFFRCIVGADVLLSKHCESQAKTFVYRIYRKESPLRFHISEFANGQKVAVCPGQDHKCTLDSKCKEMNMVATQSVEKTVFEDPYFCKGKEPLMAAFAEVNVDDHDELSENFARILSIGGDQARLFLEASTWSLEGAIDMFLNTVGGNEPCQELQKCWKKEKESRDMVEVTNDAWESEIDIPEPEGLSGMPEADKVEKKIEAEVKQRMKSAKDKVKITRNLFPKERIVDINVRLEIIKTPSSIRSKQYRLEIVKDTATNETKLYLFLPKDLSDLPSNVKNGRWTPPEKEEERVGSFTAKRWKERKPPHLHPLKDFIAGHVTPFAVPPKSPPNYDWEYPPILVGKVRRDGKKNLVGGKDQTKWYEVSHTDNDMVIKQIVEKKPKKGGLFTNEGVLELLLVGYRQGRGVGEEENVDNKSGIFPIEPCSEEGCGARGDIEEYPHARRARPLLRSYDDACTVHFGKCMDVWVDWVILEHSWLRTVQPLIDRIGGQERMVYFFIYMFNIYLRIYDDVSFVKEKRAAVEGAYKEQEKELEAELAEKERECAEYAEERLSLLASVEALRASLQVSEAERAREAREGARGRADQQAAAAALHAASAAKSLK